MVNYQNGKIYMLWSSSTDMRYVGSTTLALSQRLAQHRCSNPTRSKLMFEECNDIKIELIENCPCDSKEELLKREGQIIRETENCINKCIAGRTPREWREDNKEYVKESKKQYRQDNREYILERDKKYYENNKVIISEKAKEYREENKEYFKEKAKEYREENKEHVKEKKKEWYEKNKEKCKEHAKEYREENKQKIKEKFSEQYECPCGGKYTYVNKTKHFKAKKHINYTNRHA